MCCRGRRVRKSDQQAGCQREPAFQLLRPGADGLAEAPERPVTLRLRLNVMEKSMSAPNSLLIVGCGDVGSRLGQRMADAGWRVLGMRRNVAALPAGIEPVAGDLHADPCPADWPRQPLDYLVYCAAATQHDEAGYRAAYVDGLRRTLGWLALHGQRPRRILFASSSGVYGQQEGEWIDEDSPAEAQSYSALIMREAERVALDKPFGGAERVSIEFAHPSAIGVSLGDANDQSEYKSKQANVPTNAQPDHADEHAVGEPVGEPEHAQQLHLRRRRRHAPPGRQVRRLSVRRRAGF